MKRREDRVFLEAGQAKGKNQGNLPRDRPVRKLLSEGLMTQIQTKNDVLEVIRRSHHKIKIFGVNKLGLFGSFVRQEQNAESDIDVLVHFEPDKKTFDNFMQLSFLLEDALHRRVELVTIEALDPYIGPHILSEVEYVSFAS